MKRNRGTLSPWLAAALVVAGTGTANAHLSLTSPRPRSADIDEGYSQTSPCGGYPTTGAPAPLRAGQTITITAHVNPHTNRYRVALSGPGDTGFDAGVIGFYDVPAGPSDVTFDVTLPNRECLGCTLQVVMWDAAWYACADVDIYTGSVPQDAGSVATRDAGGRPPRATDAGAGAPGPLVGGCSVATPRARTGSTLALVGVLAALVARLRRTRGSVAGRLRR